MKNKVLRACFLLLLTGPILSYATETIVVCDVDQSAWSGWNDICLPGSSGIFTPGMTDYPVPNMDGLFNIAGTGDDFVSAWEDAERTCRSMATKINTKGKGGYALPANFTCPINSCEEYSGSTTGGSSAIVGGCECHKKTGNQCSQVGASYNISAQNLQDLYTKGMRFCAQKAQSAKAIVSVLCRYNF